MDEIWDYYVPRLWRIPAATYVAWVLGFYLKSDSWEATKTLVQSDLQHFVNTIVGWF